MHLNFINKLIFFSLFCIKLENTGVWYIFETFNLALF